VIAAKHSAGILRFSVVFSVVLIHYIHSLLVLKTIGLAVLRPCP
jgi:hypothetical protein